MLTACERVMRDLCAEMGCELREFNGENDHVHLLVHYPPKLPVSTLVNRLKGVSAHYLRKEFTGPASRHSCTAPVVPVLLRRLPGWRTAQSSSRHRAAEARRKMRGKGDVEPADPPAAWHVGTGRAGASPGWTGAVIVHELQPGEPELIGPYRVRGRLGTGGMGRVYLGLSPGGRSVAVKVIRADLAQDAEFRARFRREVAVARKVSGLFTAPVIDADVDGPVPWLATAYVPGPSLADAVSEHGPLPAASVLALARGLAEGLSAIHAAGVVHRDLKPANVLLAEDGPRVIDFGISRAVEASALTHTGLVVGSPGFMSPEQAEGREVGPPSDIFSLGAVLAFAATGQGPFGVRVDAGPGVPRGAQRASARPGAGRGPVAGRTVPGQGSGPASHRRRPAGRGGLSGRGLAARAGDPGDGGGAAGPGSVADGGSRPTAPADQAAWPLAAADRNAGPVRAGRGRGHGRRHDDRGLGPGARFSVRTAGHAGADPRARQHARLFRPGFARDRRAADAAGRDHARVRAAAEHAARHRDPAADF